MSEKIAKIENQRPKTGFSGPESGQNSLRQVWVSVPDARKRSRFFTPDHEKFSPFPLPTNRPFHSVIASAIGDRQTLQVWEDDAVKQEYFTNEKGISAHTPTAVAHRAAKAVRLSSQAVPGMSDNTHRAGTIAHRAAAGGCGMRGNIRSICAVR